MERGQYAQRDDYVPLVGITKTVDISQRESHPGRATSAASRASQSALEAYCFYEESAMMQTVAIGEHNRAESVADPEVEVADTKEIVKPEPAYLIKSEL